MFAPVQTSPTPTPTWPVYNGEIEEYWDRQADPNETPLFINQQSTDLVPYHNVTSSQPVYNGGIRQYWDPQMDPDETPLFINQQSTDPVPTYHNAPSWQPVYNGGIEQYWDRQTDPNETPLFANQQSTNPVPTYHNVPQASWQPAYNGGIGEYWLQTDPNETRLFINQHSGGTTELLTEPEPTYHNVPYPYLSGYDLGGAIISEDTILNPISLYEAGLANPNSYTEERWVSQIDPNEVPPFDNQQPVAPGTPHPLEHWDWVPNR